MKWISMLTYKKKGGAQNGQNYGDKRETQKNYFTPLNCKFFKSYVTALCKVYFWNKFTIFQPAGDIQADT